VTSAPTVFRCERARLFGHFYNNSKVIHIATVHWNSPRWIVPQENYFRRHLKSDFRVYAWLNNIPDAPTDSFYYFTREPVAPHAVKLNLLADIIAASAKPDDLLIFIDGDAFPVGDIEALMREKLSAAKLLAVQRLENNGDVQPHPCFCATTVGFWREIQGDWKEGHRWKNKNGEDVTDVGGNLLGMLERLGIAWSPMLRSNRVNLHPLFFGIYGEVIYHHGAGFRKGHCRVDEAHLSLPPQNKFMAKLFHGYRRRQQQQLQDALDAVVAKNDELSEQIFEKILRDPNFYREFM
jgi:hypothetical protein